MVNSLRNYRLSRARWNSVVLYIALLAMVASSCSSNGTTAPSSSTISDDPFDSEIVDRCGGADLDSRGSYFGPDGIIFSSPDVGLLAFTLSADTPEGSTAVLGVADQRTLVERHVTTTVTANRKVMFVFSASRDLVHNWRLTLIGPAGQDGGVHQGSLEIGDQDQPCTVEMLRGFTETNPIE